MSLARIIGRIFAIAVLLIIGIVIMSAGVAIVVKTSNFVLVPLGVFAILVGLFFIYRSYLVAPDFGGGYPLLPYLLDKKTIYILVGMLKIDPKSSIAVLKNAVGKIICVKTSTYLLAETDYVKIIELPGGKIELAPATKTDAAKEE